MKFIFYTLVGLFGYYATLQAQAPAIEWQKALGTTGDDQTYGIVQTSDGGYIAVGHTNGLNGDVTANHGGYDIWVVKLSSAGAIQWQKSYGGSADDYGVSAQQTTDGYIIGGFSFSNDGDITGHHGSALKGDAVLIKINNSGIVQWQKSYGGTNEERANGLVVVPDGFVFACTSNSNDGDVSGNHGNNDYWVFKVNNAGVLQWQKSYGGSGDDNTAAIATTNDGGFILNGYVNSPDGNVTGYHGGQDFWTIKLSSSGTLEWQKALGGSANDLGETVCQNADSTYVLAGATNSSDGNVSNLQGDYDFWVVKLNKSGVLIWQKTFGGTSTDWAQCIRETSDNGYVLTGHSSSVGGNVTGNHGNLDFWVIKLNSAGALQWQKSLGSNALDASFIIQPTTDLGYIITGCAGTNGGDVTGAHGGNDYWIVKLKTDPTIGPKVAISAKPATIICKGTLVTLSAKVTNGGASISYQWKKNNVNVGTNSDTYVDSVLVNNDSVVCTVTTAGQNINSNKVKFTVNPLITPVASIASPALTVCEGGKIQFKATVSNAGTSPLYQWVKNGTGVNSGTLTYTDEEPGTNDSIWFVLTSNAACVSPQQVTSNILAERVDVPNPVVKIDDNQDSTTICGNTKVTFKAAITPSYLWKKNGSIVGENSNTYIDSTLKTNDKIQCFLVSSASACNNNPSNILNSNILKYTVKLPPATPAAITGPALVKAGQTGIYYSVKAVAGVTYIWSLPAGAMIDSGQGGSKIKVTWGNAAGNVSVLAANSCGTSPAAQTKAVALKASLVASTVSVERAKKQADLSDDIHLTPNPATSYATLTFAAKAQDKYSITITDAQNKVVEVKNVVSVKGVNTVKVNTVGLAKGMYFITLSNKQAGNKGKQLIVGE